MCSPQIQRYPTFVVCLLPSQNTKFNASSKINNLIHNEITYIYFWIIFCQTKIFIVLKHSKSNDVISVSIVIAKYNINRVFLKKSISN